MAEKAITEQEISAYIPPPINYPCATRVSVAYDNMDINQETLNGPCAAKTCLQVKIFENRFFAFLCLTGSGG